MDVVLDGSPLTIRQVAAVAVGAGTVSLDAAARERRVDFTLGSRRIQHYLSKLEDGRIVVEPVRPKVLEPASDVGAREERQRRFAEALDQVTDEHRELFAMLAR